MATHLLPHGDDGRKAGFVVLHVFTRVAALRAWACHMDLVRIALQASAVFERPKDSFQKGQLVGSPGLMFKQGPAKRLAALNHFEGTDKAACNLLLWCACVCILHMHQFFCSLSELDAGLQLQ